MCVVALLRGDHFNAAESESNTSDKKTADHKCVLSSFFLNPCSQKSTFPLEHICQRKWNKNKRFKKDEKTK